MTLTTTTPHWNAPNEGQRAELRAEHAAKVKSRLQDMVWNTAEDIGRPKFTSLKEYNDGEIAAYAKGMQNAIEIMAEREEVEVCTVQIRAALGERLRRNNSAKQKLCTRRLNNLIEAIRDKRIAMLDQYEPLDYQNEFRDWQRKVWKLERGEFRSPEEAADFGIIQRELRALMSLQSDLSNSEHWRNESWKRRQTKNAAVAA